MKQRFRLAGLAAVVIAALAPAGTAAAATAGPAGAAGHARAASLSAAAKALWVSRYNGVGGRGGSASDVVVSPDGSTVYVTGTVPTSGSDRSERATAAYDAGTGAMLWVTLSRPGDVPRAGSISLAVNPDGGAVYVIGEQGDIEALDASTGSITWTVLGSSLGFEEFIAVSVAVSPDGSQVVVAGTAVRVVGSEPVNEYAAVAYDAGTGTVNWTGTYDGPQNLGSQADSVALSPDGSRVFVTGTSAQSRARNATYATVAFDAGTGATVWSASYTGQAHTSDKATSVGVSPDGSQVFVTGQTGSLSTGTSFATVAYSATTGSRQWVRLFQGLYASNSPVAMVVNPDGSGLYVVGDSESTGTEDFETVAYSTAGTQLWTVREGSPASRDVPFGAAVSPDGSEVFATGHSFAAGTTGQTSYATFAYNTASGALIWKARYAGLGVKDSTALAVAVSPDSSRVFVTGQSSGKTGPGDFATLAYNAAG